MREGSPTRRKLLHVRKEEVSNFFDFFARNEKNRTSSRSSLHLLGQTKFRLTKARSLYDDGQGLPDLNFDAHGALLYVILSSSERERKEK